MCIVEQNIFYFLILFVFEFFKRVFEFFEGRILKCFNYVDGYLINVFWIGFFKRMNKLMQEEIVI